MPPGPPPPPLPDPLGGRPVTIGLINGATATGRLERFAPDADELVLDLGGKVREHVSTESIAYVGFHRLEDESVAPPSAAGAPYKIHLSGGVTFAVMIARPLDATGAGFRAVPRDDGSPYRELFFYSQGIRAREKDTPIGAMLVKSGAVHPDALEHAIVTQRTERVVPIGKILVENLRISDTDVTRAVSQQRDRNQRIGEVLVEQGLATAEDVQMALKEQQRRKTKRIGEVLIDLNIVSPETLARTLAAKFDLRFVDLDQEAPNPDAIKEVSNEIIARYGVLPIAKTARGLVVAVSDPLALEGLDQIRFATGRRVEEVIATPGALKRCIDAALGKQPSIAAESDGAELETILQRLAKTPDTTREESAEEVASLDPSDSAVVSLVNQIIHDAYRRGASDIHVEPNGRDYPTLVRFRVDGECSTFREIPAAHRSAVVARIKILARLDIAERRKPQDGKIRFRLPDRQIELRVATIPTVNGNEDVVMRVLAASKPLPLSALALTPRNLRELERLVRQPYGLVLCVGPTGSGKTTTLHAALGSINTDDMKIWTAEDPVEITQRGLRQVQVNPRIGFTFAQAMRSFLRADPDVIMVGEMRDEETASTGVEASLTGHLVFSTLHTNSAPETITRLLDMGLDPLTFGDALLGVLAQRLVRRLCGPCRTKGIGTPEEQAMIESALGPDGHQGIVHAAGGGPLDVWRAVGCEACGGTGYKGRVGVHELLVADPAIKSAVSKRAPIEEIRQLARAQGMTTLLQDGVMKALSGVTDLKQVLAVCR